MERRSDGSLAPITWADAERRLAGALTAARRDRLGAIRLLTRPEPGSVGALQRAFLRALGAGDEARVVFDPFDPPPLRAASEALFGSAELPVYDVAAARTVVAFGADFQGTWLSPAGLSSGLAAGRSRQGEARTRLAWVGPRRGQSGATAERWLRSRAGEEPAVALALLHWLVDPGHAVTDLAPEAAELWPRLRHLQLEDLALRAGVERAELEALAAELAGRRPSALLGPGIDGQGPNATQLSALLGLLDLVLGNLGKTVFHGLDTLEDPANTYADVTGAIEALARDQVEVLLVHRTDPAGTLPAALGVAEALRRVPLLVCFAGQPDATTALAHLVLPDHHALESQVDVLPRAGVVNLGAPAVPPSGDTRSTVQVLLEVANLLPFPAAHFPWSDPAAYWEGRLEKYAMALTGTPPVPVLLAEAVRRGGLWRPAQARSVMLRPGAASRFLEPPPVRPVVAGGLDLVPFPGGEPAWACVELSPATAGRLGVRSGVMVSVVTPSGRARLRVSVNAGLRDDAAGVPIGPADSLALLPARPEDQSGAQCFPGETAIVRS